MRYAVPLFLRDGAVVLEERDVIVEAPDTILAQVAVKNWVRSKEYEHVFYAKIGRPTESTAEAELHAE